MCHTCFWLVFISMAHLGRCEQPLWPQFWDGETALLREGNQGKETQMSHGKSASVFSHVCRVSSDVLRKKCMNWRLKGYSSSPANYVTVEKWSNPLQGSVSSIKRRSNGYFIQDCCVKQMSKFM